MFHPIYTLANNNQIKELMRDPLNLGYAMRFYPHDDNQGGFFVAVFEKFAEQSQGILRDTNYQGDPWSDTRIRQKNLLEEIEDFAKWYEKEQAKEWEANNVPEEEREDLGLMEMVNESKEKYLKMQGEGEGVVNLSEARKERDKKREDEEFVYGNLKEKNQKGWDNIQEFYGIDDSFPCDYLYFQKTEQQKRVVMLNPGLHMLMLTC